MYRSYMINPQNFGDNSSLMSMWSYKSKILVEILRIFLVSLNKTIFKISGRDLEILGIDATFNALSEYV